MRFARTRVLWLSSAALLASTLAACSGGGGTSPAVPAGAFAAAPAALLSNDSIIASPPGEPTLAAASTESVANLQSVDATASEQTLFADSFAGNTATGWTIAQGAWSVQTRPSQSGEYTGTTDHNATFAGDPNWTDYTVESSFRPETISGTRRGMTMIARATDANHFYQIEFANERNGNRWELWRNDGNRWVNLANGPFAYVADRQYLVRLSAYGSTLNVSIADDRNKPLVSLATVKDATYAHGRAGLRVWGGQTSRFAAFHVSKHGAPTPAPTVAPTVAPTATPQPTPMPTAVPTVAPTATPMPSAAPTVAPTVAPTAAPTAMPTAAPTATPMPTPMPTAAPTATPTPVPTASNAPVTIVVS
ncbi:MAG: hypothetical protein NVSMB21_03350 [Vulcanimicrobiaceae bacterium]